MAGEIYFLPVHSAYAAEVRPGSHHPASLRARVCKLTVEDRTGRRAERLGRNAALGPMGLAQRSALRRAPPANAGVLPAAGGRLADDACHRPSDGSGDDSSRFDRLPQTARDAELAVEETEPMPHLAALICASPFDVALHDALGVCQGCDTYQCYGRDLVNRDLASVLRAAVPSASFRFPRTLSGRLSRRPIHCGSCGLALGGGPRSTGPIGTNRR